MALVSGLRQQTVPSNNSDQQRFRARSGEWTEVKRAVPGLSPLAHGRPLVFGVLVSVLAACGSQSAREAAVAEAEIANMAAEQQPQGRLLRSRGNGQRPRSVGDWQKPRRGNVVVWRRQERQRRRKPVPRPNGWPVSRRNAPSASAGLQ